MDQCKTELLVLITTSEQNLDEYVSQVQSSFENMDQLKQQLALDKQVYILCEEIIRDYHADMEMIKIEISHLEGQLNSLSANNAATGFFRREQQTSGNEETSFLYSLLRA